MKHFIVLLSMLVLVGCNTTGKPADISDVDLTNSYTVGWYTTYSELCGHFQGSGASLNQIQSVVEKYRRDARFKRGYDHNRNLFGFDVITNLNRCAVAKTVVETVESGRRTVTAQPANATQAKEKNIRFYLDVSWRNVITGREVYPVMVKQVGRTWTVESTTITAGKTCGATFTYYDTSGSGDWDVSCTDGTTAAGTFRTRGSGKGYRGSGVDTEGNKIEFLMLRAPAKS